jgi:glycosyl hydrolase family 57
MPQSKMLVVAGLALSCGLGTLPGIGQSASAQETMNVGFMWHMHQPQYRPGENVLQTDASGVFSFSIADVHNQRLGPYTTWPKDAIQSGLALSHLGTQVSFSGSLIQNLNTLEAAGINGGQWNNWDASYKQAALWDTSLGNPRLDLVNFGFNHPLMPLLDTRDITMQIKLQKRVHELTWGTEASGGVPFSKGIFPPETAFSSRVIPALVAEGIEWSIVDSIHLERATQGYPHTTASNLYAPNKADQINPAIPADQWVQLNNLWAPSKVAAPFAYRPHNVQHVDPSTGAISQIVAVPAARYEGNEDGRGGFGALQYESVMDQYRQFNTDPDHPMFVMLHHDGDNFGGGSDSYYHSNFQDMVSWAQTNNNYDVTTVQDYLDRFPVATNDVVHVESGSWAGADNGDPEFKKWLGDPDPNTGWSPDRNSWAVLTAAKNRVFTADDIAPATNLDNILNATGTPTERAWRYLMAAEASDYWYWDGTEVWDSNVTLGSNLAVAQADQVIGAFAGSETTPPSVFVPQRESYNPGGEEWGPGSEPSDFEVWTFAYDVSGLTDVVLKYRIDGDGNNPLDSIENETFVGGTEVGSWVSIPMSSSDVAPPGNILSPTYRAERFGGMITGLEDVLVDYYVEAIDGLGNIARTDIQHVFVGSSVIDPGGDAVTIGPDPAIAGDPVLITYDPTGSSLDGSAQVFLHYGFDGWSTVLSDLAMDWNAVDETWSLQIPTLSTASQLDVVFNNGSGTWDNNGGADWHFDLTGAQLPDFVMDGQLDAGAALIATESGQSLYAELDGEVLYVATDDAGEGDDVFIYLALAPGAMTAANWGKAGQVAGWDAFIADENDNDYEGWFDVTGYAEAATGANGGVLEGIIDLVQMFGFLPDQVYLAVGKYASADGGALTGQTPGELLANGDIDSIEYILFSLGLIDGDLDGDGFVGIGDLNIVLGNWNQSVTAGDLAAGDFDGDGFIGVSDLNGVLGNWNTGTAPSDQTNIPEPGTLIVLAVGGVVMLRRVNGDR